MRVLVVGAGIAGLVAARGLLAAGHEVTVLEQSPEPRGGGCAVLLWANGTAVPEDLGVKDTGQSVDAVEVRSTRDRPVMSVDTRRLEARLGSPTVVVPRRALLARLAEGLPPGTVRFDARLRDLGDDGRSVHAETEEGERYSGDLLVGADGIGSRVRTALFGPGTRARPTGAATWRGLIPAPFDPGSSALLFLGREGTVGLNPAGDGQLQWLIDLSWAQGTGQALGDVSALVRRLAQAPDLSTALAAYERARRPQARLAATAAARGVATSGPRTLFQGEAALRGAGILPAGFATWSFERLLRGISDRL
ncbi:MULTISPECIES: NAD(P)/FAD-dependent oxidoreductase [unclassified Nocardiopsis]|uniref:FAD-dependent oxidoreductase n=1 Tax=unclassified Nocardiopsis TaxID=2649073 RepID=UPI00135C3285|nr:MULTISPECIES: FAD-dependent oxidoreductase [unclassified Nocardiopsis]